MSEPRFDATGILAAVSGQSREQVTDLWEEVKANSARLRGCPRHRFPDASSLVLSPRMELVCESCGGKMRTVDVGLYIAGYEAAGGPCDDIWPGYRRKA